MPKPIDMPLPAMSKERAVELFHKHTWWNGSHPMTNYQALANAIESERDAQWQSRLDAAIAAERERCAHICAGIGAGYAGEARRLDGLTATHAAGRRDGANECAAAIRKESTE